jgi:pimeloyl-ACP methyl ester carboxylesterase
MKYISSIIALLSVLSYSGAADTLLNCDDEFISCIELKTESNFIFDCRKATPTTIDPSLVPVMMLHGFPEWSNMYLPLMTSLAKLGYTSLACNQRGYSPRASPSSVSDYNYNYLASDVLQIATAAGFPSFHLVAHDHGAVLSWVLAASEAGSKRVKTLSALSIPHVDAFSDGLYGPNADVLQQYASQYFSMFVLPDSASINAYFWYLSLGLTSGRGREYSSGLSAYAAADFQKALWWYNGVTDAGVMAFPPNYSSSQLVAAGQYSSAFLRTLFPPVPPNDGRPAPNRSGPVSMPALYVCGASDPSILCNREYAMKTSEFCKGGYEYVEVACGHDVLSKGCKDADKVNAAIIRNIVKASTLEKG